MAVSVCCVKSHTVVFSFEALYFVLRRDVKCTCFCVESVDWLVWCSKMRCFPELRSSFDVLCGVLLKKKVRIGFALHILVLKVHGVLI